MKELISKLRAMKLILMLYCNIISLKRTPKKLLMEGLKKDNKGANQVK